MNPREHGKPGEVWRVRDKEREADWLILDGELRDTGVALGYEHPIVLVATSYDGEQSRHEYPVGELVAITSLDDPMLLDGAWEVVYPEHEKLAKVKDESQAIGEFLDFGKYTLCEWRDGSVCGYEWDEPGFVPVSIKRALAEYFGIDENKLEAEKRQMLDKLREANAR